MISGLFWNRMCRFALRKVAECDGPKVGIPGVRDPRDTCDAYSPRPPMGGDWRTCQTDHHPLCRECCHAAPEAERQIPTVEMVNRAELPTPEERRWYVN